MTTDELRAAAEMVVATGMNKDWADTIDAGAVAVCRAWLAANQMDDGEPADFEWIASQAVRQVAEQSEDVWWEIGSLSFTCETYQSDPGEPSETIATDWQVDGESLPKMLWPRTRGAVRRLVEALS